jgi:fatty-acyl-CoA synthase
MPQAGLMMELPLLLSGVLQHAEAQNGQVDVVSRETHGPLFRYTYADCAKRARQLANALAGLGLQAGDVVGSIAWNNHRHLESYYGVSGSGMVMHTCNPRLHPDQLIYIINHAEDKVVLFDTTFAPLVKAIAAQCPNVMAWVCLADAASTAALEGIPHLHAYDALVDKASDQFEWPQFD